LLHRLDYCTVFNSFKAGLKISWNLCCTHSFSPLHSLRSPAEVKPNVTVCYCALCSWKPLILWTDSVPKTWQHARKVTADMS